MCKDIKNEIDKLIEIRKEGGSIRTTTIIQLLNDLRIYSEDIYLETLDMVENKGIVLIVDSTEKGKAFLDSSKISIIEKKMSVESIVKKLKYDEIDLDTVFQRRRSLWSDSVKSQLIESLMIQLPVPPLYFDRKNTNKWEVVDGLQRLCTLKEFLVEKKWRLTGMEYLTDYNGCCMDDLPRIYQRRIEESQLSCYLILPETPQEVKYSLFKRINAPGLKLEPQEIRHALYQGKATELLKVLSETPEFRKATGDEISSDRMQDRELVLRYLALHYLGVNAYKECSMDDYLNKTMKFLNEQDDKFIIDCQNLFLKSIKCVYGIFGVYAFRRISKAKPKMKKPINTALFEGWLNGVAVLTDVERKKLVEKKEKVKELYIDELDKNGTFSSDIRTGKFNSVVRRNETIQNIIREALDENK